MATKKVEIEGLGSVTLVKSRQSKSIRLSVQRGVVRVSMPMLVPYSAGVRFLTSHMSWALEQLEGQQAPLLEDGKRIGRLHTLQFVPGETTSVRVSSSRIVVHYTSEEKIYHETVQTRARKACIRALRHEAELVLPPRLRNLSEQHNLPFTSVQVKQLKRRWGSCDSQRNIVLNLFLIQLPFELIDYVLCHELAHTIHMDHGPKFWELTEAMLPDAKARRRELKRHETDL